MAKKKRVSRGTARGRRTTKKKTAVGGYEYKPLPGARFSKKMAQCLGETLDRLSRRTPNELVEASRPKNSPTHKAFEWRDSVAAHQHRIDQARDHIQHLAIVVARSDGKQKPQKAFYSIKVQDDEAPEYMHLAAVIQRPDLKKMVLQQAADDLRIWRNRYLEYADLFGATFQQISKAIGRLERAG